jgi:hypothetical protein
MTEQYTFKVGPDYTIAHGGRNGELVCLDEWTDRPLAEFVAGMGRKPGKWECRVERYEIAGRGAFEEHTWTRRV